MALGSTQPLTEMSTRNLPEGKRRPARGTDNLTAICEPIVYKMWEPRRLTTLWAFTACYRDSFTFYPPIPTTSVTLQRPYIMEPTPQHTHHVPRELRHPPTTNGIAVKS
jgi:hypothetical protein